MVMKEIRWRLCCRDSSYRLSQLSLSVKLFALFLNEFGIPTLVSHIIAGATLRHVILGFNLDPENLMSSFTSLDILDMKECARFWDLDGKDRRKPIVVVVAQCLSTFPVIVCLISELKILNSELGRLGLSCGIVSDMICLILSMATIWVMSIYRKSAKEALIDLAAMVAYIAVVFVIRPSMIWVVKQTPEGKPVKSLFINNIMLTATGFCSGG
ncbi:hypothetical protein QYF36_017499 [Acer negundo]|nr:hypothetical protein QYF36_017499 [Acer negundo]